MNMQIPPCPLVAFVMQARLNNRGQGVIEFLFCCMTFIGFLFLFFQMCTFLGFANYAQYITFMTARCYLVNDPVGGTGTADGYPQCTTQAQKMLGGGATNGGLGVFSSVAQAAQNLPGSTSITGLVVGPDPQFLATTTAFSWLQGARFGFTKKLPFAFLVTGNQQGATPLSFNFTSESWLGKEPTQAEIIAQVTSKSSPNPPVLDNEP